MVYEKGIFKPLNLKGVNLEDGSKAVVVVKPFLKKKTKTEGLAETFLKKKTKTEGLAEILEKYSRKVDKDVLKEFLEERR